MRSFVKWAAICLALASLSTAAFFGWKIYQTESEYQEGVEAYNLIAEIAQGTTQEEPGEIPASSVPEDNKQDVQDTMEDKETAGSTEAEDVTVISEESADIQASENEKPKTPEGSPDLPEIDFTALQKVNPQIIGWICSPDTVINYPVVRGDDNEYYLYHLADGTYNRNGCPFMDVKNRADFSDENTLIYGHHMQNGTMFAGISWYADQSYYDAHPVLYLFTPEKTYRLEAFSGYTTTLDSSAYMLTFADRHTFAEWLREISARSDFRAPMTLSADDHIVTLSTCAYSFENARYVLHCRMTEITR